VEKTWERIGENDPPYEYAREVADLSQYLQSTFSSNTLHFLLVYMVRVELPSVNCEYCLFSHSISHADFPRAAAGV
jgi:hypothetical protein